MYQLLQSKKYPSNRMFYSLIPEGEHKEVFWNKEFYKVYDFLFILKPKWFSEILAFKSLIIKLINQENQANHFNLGIDNLHSYY
ncbi:MAG: hypothetical protein NW226_22370 [Microscillaceae bacterium]|nr:hypothetical protein [Microscillaceae bacterium]